MGISYICGMSMTKEFYEESYMDDQDTLDFEYQYELWKQQMILKYEEYLSQQNNEQPNGKEEENN